METLSCKRCNLIIPKTYHRQKYCDKCKQKLKEMKKKRRQLDRNIKYSMNEKSPGFDSHHISRDTVIHIPYRIHHSIYHNIWTGENMDKINDIAFDWLYEQMIDDYKVETFDMIFF